jgi:hypothetical protein
MRLYFKQRKKRLASFLFIAPALVGGFILVAQKPAYAANPTTINFQGKVVNSDGTNPTNNTYSFIFRLYNTASPTTATACSSDSSCLFEETQGSVTVTNGVFQVELGSGCSGGLVAANSCDKSTAIDFSTSNALYLTLKFNGDAAGFMSPTIHLTTVPYAFNADRLGGLAASGFIQNTASPQSSSNFNISGTGIAGTALQAPILQTASGDLALQSATGIISLNKTGIDNEIRIYENNSNGTNYASITADHTSATFKSNSGTTKVGNGVGSITINAGTGSAVNITGHSSSTWQTDTGGSLTIQGGSTLALQSTTSNSVTLDSGSVGDIDIGTGANGKNIFIGNGTSGTAVAVSCGTGTCGFGNNAIDHSTTLGSATGTSVSTLQSGTGGTTISSTATSGTALAVSDTALTTGTALQLTLGNPQVNANAGVLTSASLINISSANHSYLSLTNRDLTFGGHINQLSVSAVQNTFVYDTTSDRDGGRWTADERAKASSWYNETKDHTQAACVVGTDDRCGSSDFPGKAILVVAGGTGSNSLYIFDATDNSLWMKFTQNAGATLAMGVNANNTISSVYAQNGNIYVSTNGSAATGMYEINFKADRITRINSTDSRDYAGNIGNRNTAQTAAYADQTRTSVKLVSNTVNDVMAQIDNGKTFIAAANGNATATNGGITLINETAQSVANFGTANENYQSVWLTADDTLYGTSSTSSELDVWYSASASSGNNVAKSTFYDETTKPALASGNAAPTINTSTPDSLYASNGTSDIDGQSNTIYVGHNNGLSVIQEKVGAETVGSVKNYTSNYISEELVGDIRNYLPFNGSGALANSSNLIDSTIKANGLTVKNANGTGITYGSGVKGTAITALDNTDDYICTGTTGTCADDADLDSAVATSGNFSIGAWAKRTTIGGLDVIASKWGNATANQAYRLYVTAGDFPACDHRGAATVTVTATAAMTDITNWHNYSCVFDNSANTLKLYVDGVLLASSADTNDTNDSGIAYSIGADLSGGSNAAADFFPGSIDEPYVTATALSASQVRVMVDTGQRALNNPNHTGASTVRGATVAADGANALLGSSVVKAVIPSLTSGQIYVGTSSGVAVVGMDTDTLTDLYSTSITTKDDINTNYDTTNGNAVNSISVSKGYGNGSLVSIGFNNSGSGGVWAESSSTGLVDFLGNSYDPFGTNLTQTNLNVDRVFRVTNQISSRLDNFSMPGTSQPQIYDLMRVDSNGLTLAPGSATLGTTIMKTTDTTGNINFSIRAMGTNFGSLVSGGAFEGKNSYWGQEYNIAQAVAGVSIIGSTTPSACSWSRGDMGGHVLAGVACNATSDQSNGAGDMTYSAANGSTTTDACLPSTVAGANGVERVLATSINTATHSDVCSEYPAGGTAGASSNFLTATNLPVMTMKIKPSTLASNAGVRVFAGMWSGGKAAVATTLPGTAASTWGAYFTNCSTTVPACSNTTWYGWVTNASATLLGSGSTSASVTCPSTQALSTSNFAYGRIEFRTATEVHFYIDSNTSDGINEVECGTGVSSSSINTGAMTPFFEAVNSNNATAATAALDVDYMRTWQDDNVNPLALNQSENTASANSEPGSSDPQTLAPITPDSSDPIAQDNLFSFNAATSEDTVFNKDVYIHGTLFADKIKANQIEGLEMFTDKISSLQQKLAAALDPKASAQSTTSTQHILPTSNPSLDLNVPGSLSISGPAEFHGNVLFYKLVTFTEKTVFNNDITIAAHVTTSGNTPSTKLETGAGITKAPTDKPDAQLAKATINGNDNTGIISINIGDNSVAGNILTVNFDKPYDKPPQVLLTPANSGAAQAKYYVTNAPDGFKIVATDPVQPGTNIQLYYWVVQ